MKAEIAKAGGETARAAGEAAKAQHGVEEMKLKLRYQELLNIKAEFEVLDAQLKAGANGPPLDSAKMHAWIGQVDQALQFFDAHAASQIAGLGATPASGSPSGNGGGGGDLSGSATSPSPSPSGGQGPAAMGNPGESSQPQSEPPPALPEGHYAPLPGQGETP